MNKTTSNNTYQIYRRGNNLPASLSNVANSLDIPNYKNNNVDNSNYKNNNVGDIRYNLQQNPTPYHNGRISEQKHVQNLGTEGIFPQMNNFKTISTRFQSRNKYGEPQVIHNNLTDKIMNETVIEYPLYADSKDRDISTFLNPFEFKVTMNPNSSSRKPHIYRALKNIRYIRSNRSILPRQIKLHKFIENQIGSIFTLINNKLSTSSTNDEIEKLVNTREELDEPEDFVIYVNIEYKRNQNSPFKLLQWTIEFIFNDDRNVLYSYSNDTRINEIKFCSYQYDSDYSLNQERFILLNLSEVNDINRHATNSKVASSFSILYPTIITKDFFHGDPDDLVKTYKNSNLGNLKFMTISYCDSFGKPLTVNHLNKHIKTSNCYCRVDNDGNEIINYQCPCTYIRHPLYYKIQTHTAFRVGILENDIGKEVFS